MVESLAWTKPAGGAGSLRAPSRARRLLLALAGFVVAGRRSGRPGGRPRGGQGLLHHERRRRRAGHAQRRCAHHRHPHARLLRHLSLRLLGPLHQGRRRHQGARRERTVDADPATTVPYKFSQYAIVGTSSGELRDLRRRGPGDRRRASSSTSRSSDTTATFSVRVRRQGRRQALHRHGAALLAVHRRRHGGRVAQCERHRASAGGCGRRPGARLGARAPVGHGDHRAGRQRADEGRPAAGVHLRRGPHPVPGGGAEQGAAAAGGQAGRGAGRGEAVCRRGQPRAAWARIKVGLWGLLGVGVPVIALVLISAPVLPLRARAEDAVPGAVPARLPTAAAAAGARRLHLATWAAWAATTSPPRCSTS